MSEKLEMRPGGVISPPRQGVAPQMLDTTTKYDNIGSIEDVRKEIDEAFDDMRQFYIQEPDEVMRLVSGHLARLTEISKEIRRIEGVARHLKSIRTNELDPAADALWQQYQIASRLLEVRKIDVQLAGQGI